MKQQQETFGQTNGSNMVDQTFPSHGFSRSNGGDSANGTSSSSESVDEDQIRIKFADWGFKIDRLFEVAYRFYKRNEGKAFHPSFDERNKMIALIMQARYGNLDGGRAPELGALDLVGKGRQHEWSLLNGMSKTEAMSKFICALDDLCPLFKAHAEAVKLSSGIEQSPMTSSQLDQGNEADGNTRKKSEMDTQMHNIYSSLCKQTYNQFKGYAEKQYPSDAVKQKYLITSLQEQYYQQYISQMHPEFKGNLPDSCQTSNQSSNIPSSLSSPSGSDRSNHVNGSPKANTLDDPAIIPENQLMLVPSTPHLELPLPENNIGSSRPKAEETSATGNNLVSNCSSINESDIFCEENNVQADISSEELNSELAATEAPRTCIEKVDQELTEDLKLISLEQERPLETEPTHKGFIEPTRVSHDSDFPPIGVFESFPEPKPIKSNSQKSTPIDQINPNLPSSLPVPQRPATVQVEQRDDVTPVTPVINSINQPSSYELDLTNDKSNSEQVAHQDAASPQISHYDSADHSNQKSNEQPPCSHVAPRQASPATKSPVHLYENPSELVASMEDGDGMRQRENNKESHFDKQPERDASSRNQAPELWDCMSSSGGHSPVQQFIPYEEPEAATIWTKREISEFKESLGDDKQGGVYEVKESTLVVIQVPTYPDGKYIYWEFATDDFDIGFGLEFVYEKHLAEPLALNIYEDLDEDDMEDMIEEETDDSSWPTADKANGRARYSQLDAETGEANQLAPNQAEIRQRMLAEKRQRLANTISIVPTYRRDSHQEVFVGRHKYPGQGYYLLRFDNTYSVLRSKTLYFRICYFM